jgi:hypothetical protein
MNQFKKVCSSLCFFFLLACAAMAQTTTDSVEMADMMRSNGKIYVVVTVLSVVFLGIITFLIMIDRKVSRLEKEIGERK